MYVLGIDVGTTNTKALLAEQYGRIVSRANKGYGLVTAPGGIAEQDPEDWWDAIVSVVREATEGVADKSRIAALSLSTQGASSVLLGADKTPCGSAVTWLDSRAVEEKRRLEAMDHDDWIYKTTGYKLSESLDAAKLLWYKHHRRELFETASAFVSTIEYINYKLTGDIVVDPANAAIRQLMDIHTSRWSEELLDYIGFPVSKMPAVAPAGTLVGTLTPEAAEQTGLDRGTRVYLGAHDQYCAALGTGATRAGRMVLSTGTAWVMLGITDRPMLTTSCISSARHIVDGLWGALASIPAAGASLEWFRRISPDDYAAIDGNASTRMNGAKELFFYPYFTGAGFPFWKTEARAVFSGLYLEHDRYDMYRAIMEGIAFQVRFGIKDYRSNGTKIDRLSVTGGAAKSPLWLDIIAAATGAETYGSEEKDAACVGAAMIAAVGEGWYQSYDAAAKAFVKPEVPITADPDMAGFYQNKLKRYTEAWMRTC